MCQINKGHSCHSQYQEMRSNCQELRTKSVDFPVIGQILAHINMSDQLEIKGRKTKAREEESY